MELYLVRHGETEENTKGIVQGQNPGHLTLVGERQAQRLGEFLKNQRFDAFYSSDLKRCVDTAKHIHKFHPELKLELTPALREINFGVYQGHRGSSIDWKKLKGSILDKRAPGGETNLEMSQRVINFINQLYTQLEGKKVLCITHGGPLRAIRACVENVTLEQLLSEHIKNTAAYKINLHEPLDIKHIKSSNNSNAGYSEAFWYS